VSRSLTVSVPSARRIGQVLLAIALAIALLYLGLRIGRALTEGGPAARFAAPGALQEIQLADGSFYLGRIVADEDDYVRLAGAAIVRSDQAQGGGGSRLIVQLVVAEPQSIAGDLLVPREQILYIGNVAANSGLETAYRQATGELPQPSAPPGGTAPPSPGVGSTPTAPPGSASPTP
jgi:hypothetical protein